MNNEIDVRVIDAATKLMELVLKCNGAQGWSNRRGHPTFFCDFAGHTTEIRIMIYLGGWKPDKEPDDLYTIYLDDNTDSVIKEIQDAYSAVSDAYTKWRTRVEKEEQENAAV